MNWMDWSNGVDFNQFDPQQALTTAILWMMALLGVLGIIFAFLVKRQAKRMATVLPTPITPGVMVVAWAYLLLTIVVLGLIVNFLVLGW